MVAVKAFREAYVTANANVLEDFDSFAARQVRYDIMFASYENTAYRNIHTWANSYKTVYGMYKSIRNIYNPTFRLVEFWKTMIFGGLLDPEAGESGAIPINTENKAIRGAIKTLWKASNWKINKDLVPLFGTSMGDVGIKICDDVAHEEMYLEVIHPSMIADIDVDTRGRVKGYQLEEMRYDEKRKACKFTEEAIRGEGEDVIFRTYKDGKLFAWDGVSYEWTEPYGFIPFVFVKHSDAGRKFGWAEAHPGRSKISELDDTASKLHDYIRKSIDPVWLFNFKKPSVAPKIKTESSQPTENHPEPRREETDSLYIADTNAKAQPLVTDLVDVEKVANSIERIIAELERDFPELQMDIWTVGGYTTGKALRTARQRVERKVIQRRPAYDTAMVDAQSMAIAIGGMRGYEGYEGFNLGSYKAGDLDHTIPATRPIFQTDVLEGVEIKQIFWNIVTLAKEKQMPVDEVLKDLGWTKSRTDEFMAALEKIKEESESESESETDAATTDGMQGADNDKKVSTEEDDSSDN